MVEFAQTYKTKSTTAKIIAPDILFLTIHSDEILTVAESQIISNWAMSQFDGKSYKVLTEPELNSQIESEVRNYLVAQERKKRVLADAIIITNLPHRLLADFYMKFHRPDIPTKFFKNKEEAFEWLNNL